IELLIAMSVMTIAITAIVAGFSSGMVALANASRAGTAGTLADKQMEAYRAVAYDAIQVPLPGGSCPTDPSTPVSPWTPSPTCPVQYVKGPDGRSYRVDTSSDWACPVGDRTPSSGTPTACLTGATTVARPVKHVAVTVRDIATTKTYVSESSTFD